MRISDWSSDVCSSDLPTTGPRLSPAPERKRSPSRRLWWSQTQLMKRRGPRLPFHQLCLRSEEHTSELQSLMRISYAVFCLKKKKEERQSILLNSNQSMKHRPIATIEI